MACTLDAPCGGALVEDAAILREQLGFRFFRCGNGHSHKVVKTTRRQYGRPVTAQCKGCGVMFERVPISRRAGRLPLCCSRACAHDVAARARMKLHSATVVRLYVGQHWTLMRIARHFGLAHHEAVTTALRRAGVKPRVHTSTRQCIEPDCRRPVDAQVDRARHGSTRCRAHRMARERARSLKWWRAHRGKAKAA
jgi:hypothetical protein